MKWAYVVDTNIIFAALITKTLTRELIFLQDNLFTLEYMILEFEKYISHLVKKTKQPKHKILELFKLICDQITIVPNVAFECHLNEAFELIKDIDENGVHFVACCIYLRNGILWSNDKQLKRIKGIIVMNTEEIYELYKESN